MVKKIISVNQGSNASSFLLIFGFISYFSSFVKNFPHKFFQHLWHMCVYVFGTLGTLGTWFECMCVCVYMSICIWDPRDAWDVILCLYVFGTLGTLGTRFVYVCIYVYTYVYACICIWYALTLDLSICLYILWWEDLEAFWLYV